MPGSASAAADAPVAATPISATATAAFAVASQTLAEIVQAIVPPSNADRARLTPGYRSVCAMRAKSGSP